MKVDGIINHDKALAGSMKAFGLSDERVDEINKFMNGLFEQVAGPGINKTEVVEKIILFADTTVEAVLLYGYFESEFARRDQNPIELLIKNLADDSRRNKKATGKSSL